MVVLNRIILGLFITVVVLAAANVIGVKPNYTLAKLNYPLGERL